MSVVENERTTEPHFEAMRGRRFIPETEERRTTASVVGSAFAIDAIAAAATVVLSILGLCGIYTAVMVPVAVLTLASALLLKSGGVASRIEQLFCETAASTAAHAELATGMSAEMVGGFTGLVLGILALIGLIPGTLAAIAVIVFGGALLLGSGETYRVSWLGAVAKTRESVSEHIARLSAESAAGGESLVGIAAVVLGILALLGIQSGYLILVGLICLGGAMVLSGAAIGARLLAAMH